MAYERLSDPKFWQELNPNHSLASVKPVDLKIPALSAPLVGTAQARLDYEGYIHLKDAQNLNLISAIQALVTKIVEQGLPPVFAFLYDEPWISFFNTHNFVGQILGAQYKVLPDFWMWHVDPQKSQNGWSPHRDKGFMALFPNKRPKSLTIWIPITEANPLNSCMYIVPAHLDPTYGTPQDGERSFDYSSIRALPASPGDIYCWNQAVLHWGARSSKLSNQVRISMALEFQHSGIPPLNQPLLEPLSMLTFEQRLALISKQILQYAHMYALDSEMEQFARVHTNQVQALF